MSVGAGSQSYSRLCRLEDGFVLSRDRPSEHHVHQVHISAPVTLNLRRIARRLFNRCQIRSWK